MNAKRTITHVPRRGASRGLLRDERGATAVEFGLVAVPFFALIFVIVEAGINFYAASSLDNALRISTRDIQTGSAQASGINQEQFRAGLCSRLPPFMACDRVKLDVRPVRLTGLGAYMGKSADGLPGDLKPISPDEDTGDYCVGRPGDYMLARALFELPNVTGMAISRKVSGTNGDVYVVDAARVFRNEPFSPGNSTC